MSSVNSFKFLVIMSVLSVYPVWTKAKQKFSDEEISRAKDSCNLTPIDVSDDVNYASVGNQMTLDRFLDTRDYNAIQYLYEEFQDALLSMERRRCRLVGNFNRREVFLQLPYDKFPTWNGGLKINTFDLEKSKEKIQKTLSLLNSQLEKISTHITLIGYDGQPIPSVEVMLEFIGIGINAPIVRWRGSTISNSFVLRAELRAPLRGSLNVYIKQGKSANYELIRGVCKYVITESVGTFTGNQRARQEDVIATNEQEARLKVRAMLRIDSSATEQESHLPVFHIVKFIVDDSSMNSSQSVGAHGEIEIQADGRRNEKIERRYVVKIAENIIDLSQSIPQSPQDVNLLDRRTRHYCMATCPINGRNDQRCTGYINGEGKGGSQSDACLAAQKAANDNMKKWNQDRGLACQKAHCNCACNQR